MLNELFVGMMMLELDMNHHKVMYIHHAVWGLRMLELYSY